MNQRATASTNSLIKALPFDIPDDLLLLSIFGSQVKGTERPDSDLDVLYVTRTSKILPINTIRDAITKTPGGVTGATVIPHGPDTITRTANVYGSVEWGVLREQGAKTLWRSVNFDVKLHREIDYDYSAGRWLDMARNTIFPEEDYSESLTASTCFWMHMAISDMLKAGLISARIKFPFTRDIRVLYGMLPAERRPPLDVEAAAAILERYDKDRDDKKLVPGRRACGYPHGQTNIPLYPQDGNAHRSRLTPYRHRHGLLRTRSAQDHTFTPGAMTGAGDLTAHCGAGHPRGPKPAGTKATPMRRPTAAWRPAPRPGGHPAASRRAAPINPEPPDFVSRCFNGFFGRFTVF